MFLASHGLYPDQQPDDVLPPYSEQDETHHVQLMPHESFENKPSYTLQTDGMTPLPPATIGALNDEQLEELCLSVTQAMETANIRLLAPTTWDMVRWENAKEVLTARIVAGKADSHSVDNDLLSFIAKVEGTSRDFQCMVPIYNHKGALVHCRRKVQRRDRILRHVKDNHL